MNVGIICYASIGGSGIVATELAHVLAARGHDIHLISAALPFRWRWAAPGLDFESVETPSYPLFREPQYLLALTNFKFVHPALRFPLANLNRLVTTGLLPEPVREQMQLPWGPKEQRRFDRFFAVVRTVNRFLPRFVRVAPTWVVLQDFRFRIRRGLPLV